MIYIRTYAVFPLLALLLITMSCKQAVEQEPVVASQDTEQAAKTTPNTNAAVSAIPVYTFKDFEHLLYQKDDKTYLVNFWATWCKPCIKEMPYFEQLAEQYKDKNVEVLFVSLDFPDLLESQVIPFIARKQIKSKVVLLDDTGANEWIPKVDPSWSGAIPATVIYNSKGRKFYERMFTLEELETELKTLL